MLTPHVVTDTVTVGTDTNTTGSAQQGAAVGLNRTPHERPAGRPRTALRARHAPTPPPQSDAIRPGLAPSRSQSRPARRRTSLRPDQSGRATTIEIRAGPRCRQSAARCRLICAGGAVMAALRGAPRLLLFPSDAAESAAGRRLSVVLPAGAAPDPAEAPPPARKRQRLTHLTPEEKALRRKLKNRVAAQSARDRKKARMTELEQQVVELEEENQRLLRENQWLREQTGSLSLENQELRCRLGLDALKTEPECESTVSAVSPRRGRVRRCLSVRSPWGGAERGALRPELPGAALC
uniref:X-box-binding protein 1 n=1 Tax=Gallus gallus TaxID=9031 RepID=A0A8V0ZPR6_CHICK